MQSTECSEVRGARRARSARGRGALVWVLSFAGGLAAFAASAEAHALPLVTLSGSLRGLYGSATDDPALDPYGAGIGVRAGVTLPASLYLGASLDYFFGESESVLGVDASASLLQLMGNVGVDWGLGPLTLRPSLGFGLAQSNVELGDSDTSEGDFVLSPGAELFVGLGLLNVSGELRYNAILADEASNAVVVGLGLGFSL